MNINKTDEEYLKDFLLDIDCLDELSEWSDKFNIFDVLRISTMEIRHSNVLAWLLNPNENHGFGDLYLREILQILTEKSENSKYDVFKLLLLDMYSFYVYREIDNIDILLVSSDENTVIAIENKVYSTEHSNQLNRYRKIIESKYRNFEKIYIYLTPEGEEASDSNWDALSYCDVVESLEKLYDKVDIKDDVRLLVKNYIETLRRYVVKDEKLIEICNKIYNKHKKALDLIYDYKVDEGTQTRNLIKEMLATLSEEGKIIYNTDWKYTFRTKEIDDILPLLPTAISSWNSTNIYCFWIKFKDNKIAGTFELGGLNIPDECQDVVAEIINTLKPKDKNKDSFKYKRVYTTKWYEIDDVDNLEEVVEKNVRAMVDELLKMQENLLLKIQ